MTPPAKTAAAKTPVRSMSDLSVDERRALLDAARDEANKVYGAHTVIRLGADDPVPIASISTGLMGLDIALGCGGFPKGRIVEIYGPESAGKTSLAIQAIAEAQKEGGLCAFIDAEHAMDPVYARGLGVNIDDLYVSQPDSGEQAFETMYRLISTGALAMCVVDSVAALSPRMELDGEFGAANVGAHPRMMSQGLRKLTGVISRSGTIVIFINQLREKIGQMYGNPEYQPGGRSLKFYSSVRLDVRRQGKPVEEDGEAALIRTKIKIVKNKVGKPFQEVEADMRYGVGFVKESSLLEVAAELGVIKQAGAWFSYEGEQIGQGSAKAQAWLREHPSEANDITQQIRKAVGF